MQKKWYAVYAKPNNEKKVSALLTKKKIENYCPLNRATRLTTNEKRKESSEPLFQNYVFVHITEQDIAFIKQQSGVINFVYWLGRPVIIKGVEIENIQEFVETYSNIYLEKTEVSMNNMVRIVNKTPNFDEFDNVITINSTIVKITLPTMGYMLCAKARDEEFQLEEVSYGVRMMEV